MTSGQSSSMDIGRGTSGMWGYFQLRGSCQEDVILCASVRDHSWNTKFCGTEDDRWKPRGLKASRGHFSALVQSSGKNVPGLLKTGTGLLGPWVRMLPRGSGCNWSSVLLWGVEGPPSTQGHSYKDNCCYKWHFTCDHFKIELILVNAGGDFFQIKKTILIICPS